MTRLRLLLLVAGAGTLLAGLPAYGERATPAPLTLSTGDDNQAVELLTAASRAARTRSYTGTQYVSTWHADAASSSVAEVRHTATGSVVSVRPTAGAQPDSAVTPTPDLDPRLLRLLTAHYDLAMAADTTCSGRAVHVVDAVRGQDGTVAGRFWVDTATRLVLRRETFDTAGRLVRSSAFATVTVGSTFPDSSPGDPGSLDAGERDRLRRDGWRIPDRLAGGLELYDARIRTHDGRQVLHLAYSDGLSTLSLFAQRGKLGAGPMSGFSKHTMGLAPVWVKASSPERVVWGGGGRVFTLLSDASPAVVRAAVSALPHDKAPRSGMLARLGRGLARLGSWLNPFD